MALTQIKHKAGRANEIRNLMLLLLEKTNEPKEHWEYHIENAIQHDALESIKIMLDNNA